jgi:hypothetical protein
MDRGSNVGNVRRFLFQYEYEELRNESWCTLFHFLRMVLWCEDDPEKRSCRCVES